MKKGKKTAKKKKWLPFEEARVIIQAENIASMTNYLTWWDRNRPAQIPRRPYRVYIKEWQGWNDFLGNQNEFTGRTGELRKIWRNFDEAIVYVHSLHLENTKEYLKLSKQGKLPEDIPGRPDTVYKKRWISWNHWLGNNVRANIQARQEVQSATIFYVVQLVGRPANVFKFGIAAGGKSQVAEMQKKSGCQIIKLFKMERGFNWSGFVGQYGTDWLNVENVGDEYVVPNIHQLLFDIDLEWA